MLPDRRRPFTVHNPAIRDPRSFSAMTLAPLEDPIQYFQVPTPEELSSLSEELQRRHAEAEAVLVLQQLVQAIRRKCYLRRFGLFTASLAMSSVLVVWVIPSIQKEADLKDFLPGLFFSVGSFTFAGYWFLKKYLNW